MKRQTGRAEEFDLRMVRGVAYAECESQEDLDLDREFLSDLNIPARRWDESEEVCEVPEKWNVMTHRSWRSLA